jgi:hypothetical protein
MQGSRLVAELMHWNKEAVQRAALHSSKCACVETVQVLFYKVGNPNHNSESTLQNCVQITNTDRFSALPVVWKNLLNICWDKYGFLRGYCIFTSAIYLALSKLREYQLKHLIAGYSRQVWDKNDWLNEGEHGFRPGYSCEIQVITVCQDVADSLDEGIGIDAIIIDFSKAFDLVPRDPLLTKLAASGMDSRVREFLVGRT